MCSEATTTTEETVTDNLNVEPENNSDNSNTDKPENTDKTAVNDDEKGTKEEDSGIPKKFLKEDGTPDIENLTKSYRELEPLLNEKANWAKEKAELETKAKLADSYKQQQDIIAKNMGFNDFSDLEN